MATNIREPDGVWTLMRVENTKKSRNPERSRPSKYVIFFYLIAGAGFAQDPTIAMWV